MRNIQFVVMVDDIRKILGILAQEVNRREEKRGLMDIDVGERDNDSDMSPSKK